MMTATGPASEESAALTGPRPRGGWTSRAVFKVGCVAAALAHPVASALSRRFWFADLISHFQEPALAATVLAVAVTARRHRRVALALALLAAFQLVPLLRYSGSNSVLADPGSRERLRVLIANVLYDNSRYDEVAALIRAEKPDVVGLLEYSQEFSQGLSSFQDEYPYRMEYPHGASGISLWFRREPLKLDSPEWLAPEGNCVLHAAFEFAGKVRNLWVAHPTSPLYRYSKAGNPELSAIAARVRETGGSCLVVGDMNCTDGSAHFGDFLTVSGLRDSRLGFGRQPTWPTNLPYRIAIDHAFVPDDLAVVDRRVGPAVGSDHFPVILELAPAATNPAAQPAAASRSSP